MSLLLDALKQAERNRKQGDAEQGEATPPPASEAAEAGLAALADELELLAADEPASAAPEVSAPEPEPEPIEPAAAAVEDGAAAAEDDEYDGIAIETVDDWDRLAGEELLSLDDSPPDGIEVPDTDDDAESPAATEPPAATEHPVPREVASAPADPLVERERLREARHVLAAAAGGRSRSRARPMAAQLGLGLAAVLVIGLAVFWMADPGGVTPSAAPPMAADAGSTGVEADSGQAPVSVDTAIDPPPQPAEASPASTPASTPALAPALAPEPSPASPPSSTPSPSPVEDTPVLLSAQPVRPEVPAEAPSPPPQAPAREQRDTTREAVRPALPAVTPQVADNAPGRVMEIRRSGPSPDQTAAVAHGRALLGAGDLEGAERRFRGLLEVSPGLTAARLGLAGVAMARGDLQTAADHYLAVLQAAPQDRDALAGLLTLPAAASAGLDPRELVSRFPDFAPAHFVRANVYAAQGRWAEAQVAYFEARRLDTDNPDYAFNLAVALDMLGRSQAALPIYRDALSLAGRRAHLFDPAEARRRIAELERHAATPTADRGT